MERKLKKGSMPLEKEELKKSGAAENEGASDPDAGEMRKSFPAEDEKEAEAYEPEYGREIREGFLGREERERTDEEILGFYKKLMESGECISDMTFDFGDRYEGLSAKEGGVTILLPARETIDDVKAESESPAWVGGGFLNRRYAVKVLKVDDETKTVTVSHREAKAKYRSKVFADIRKALGEGKKPIVKARVKAMPTHYTRDTNKSMKKRQHSNLTAERKCTAAILEIEGLGINGWLANDAFMDCYIPDLMPFIKVGDVIDVAILRENEEPYRGKDGKGKPQPVFVCSRRDAVESCWKDLNLKKGISVVVTCISKQETAWTGVTDDKNITFRCRYPYDIAGVGPIKIGHKYFGKIDEFDPKAHVLNVSVRQECNSLGGI